MEPGVDIIIGVAFVVALEMLAGIFSNVFILIHIFLEFLHFNSVGTRHKILVALCVSSLCYTTMILHGVLSSLVTSSTSVLCFLYVLMMYSILSCSWLTACLCFFYCIKILHFKSQLLVQLQMKIKTVVPWLILVVEMISVGGSLSNVQLFRLSPEFGQNLELGNFSASIRMEAPIYMYIIYTVNLVPFLIVMVTAMSTVASLILHMGRMRRSLETTGSTRMTAHHGALRTVLGLLCLYTTYYIAMFLSIFLSYSPGSLGVWIYRIIIFSFSPVQVAILIQSNPKLWKSVLRVAARLSCSQKPDKPM